MSNRKELPYDPIPGESLFSFLLRRSRAIGLNGIRALARVAGIKFDYERGGSLVQLSDFADQFGKFLHVDPGALREIGYGPGPRGDRKVDMVGFGGMLLPRNSIDLGRHRICPECVEEAWFAKAVWDLPVIAVCPKHRLVLVDRCERCKRFLGSVRMSPHVCRCGWPLRKLSHVSADDGAVEMAARMYASLGLNLDGVPDPSAHDEFSFHELCQLVWTLRRMQRPKHAPRLPHLFSRRSLDERYRMLSDAASVLADWPRRLHEICEGAEPYVFRGQMVPPTFTAGHPYRLIIDLPAGPLKDFMKKAWHARPDSGGRALPTGRTLLERRRRDQFKLLTGGEVRKVLGITPDQMVVMKENGTIRSRPSTERLHAKWDIDEIAALLDQGPSVLPVLKAKRPTPDKDSLTRMARLMGLGKRTLRRMILAIADGPYRLEGMVSDTARDTVDRFESRLKGILAETPVSDEGDGVSLNDIALAHRRHRNVGTLRATELLVAGRLKPKSRFGRSDTLPDLCFDRKLLQPKVMEKLLERGASRRSRSA